MLPGGVGLADRGRVFLLLFGRHQVALCALCLVANLGQLGFQLGALMLGTVSLLFKAPNFRGALIELVFDLGAPLWDTCYFCL
jgi:hypothetical protein